LNSVYTYNQTIGNVTMTLANPTGVATVVARPDVTSPRRDLPAARKTQWSFDFQRELTGSTGLQVQYIGSHTDHLDRGFMNNTPQPGPGAIASRQPNQLWGVLRTIQNDLVSDYHAVSFILRQNVAHGLQGVVHYTWSGTWDMASHSNSTAGRGMDPYDIQREYARASIDVPHRFVASYIYNLPFFEKSDRRILRTVLAGWQISGITTIESGTPINVTIAGDRANTGTSLQRPDMIGTPTANCGKQNLINCISSDAFAMPALYTYGNSPRNQVRGPGSISTDLSLTKDFRLKGRARLQLRAEAFNAFNRANFGDPASVDHLRRQHARGAVGVESHLLNDCRGAAWFRLCRRPPFCSAWRARCGRRRYAGDGLRGVYAAGRTGDGGWRPFPFPRDSLPG
jgi:hypothetical protein